MQINTLLAPNFAGIQQEIVPVSPPSTYDSEDGVDSVELETRTNALQHKMKSSIAVGPNKKNTVGALPKINNQETVIMRARNDENDLMLMHNTRIFYFEQDPKVDGPSLDDAASIMTDNINDMLMTPKYRLLSAFYLSFRLLDNSVLVTIILSLFTGKNSELEFDRIFLDHWQLFAAIALELLYDVLEYNVRVWIINRVSVYFVLVLYGIYAGIVTYYKIWTFTVIALLSIRFFSFLCEFFVDFCIDLELDYDLRNQCIHALDLKCIEKLWFGNLGYELRDQHMLNVDKLPTGWHYKGSIYAWTWYNVFKLPSDKMRKEDFKYRYWFILMAIFTIILTLPITIIVGMIMFLLNAMIYCCTCCRVKYDDTIFAECTRKASW